MIKFLQFLAAMLVSVFIGFAQTNNQVSNVISGYYQTINLDDHTPCNCSEKTQRTYDLAKGLRPSDVREYQLHAYKFTFGSTTLPVTKLFKAMEADKSIYKVSMKEWDSFMLLTTNEFDVQSFETAASKIFASFLKVQPEEFLIAKNISFYNEYKEEQDKIKKMKEQVSQPNNSSR